MQTRTLATRRKLLDAARVEFAQHGISGARVDRIASASGVNKQRIYANFDSKEGLFAATIADAYEDLGRSVPVPDTLEATRQYVGGIFDYHAQDPTLARLIAWEGLHYGGQDFPDREARVAYYEEKCGKLSQALGLACPSGAAHLVLTLIAIATWPYVAEQQRALLTAQDTRPDALRDSLLRQGLAVIEAAIAAPEATRH
ncbi:TetR family transcriptional regulator [Streptomyces sp. UNOC14_S4]|uniref:TetR family transcriptional regulator n=1 Tax=Streptomyces sp. UNOC14_S4 TaxID=2872340 RepID=UPI001E51A43A|nr:TetR family transcriptional regulator [Streptomyces sp. UNOC14_S4]MCC3767832.1 TetR family transcriptional regulator [Streptomyces sp. UNOC14_S4]